MRELDHEKTTFNIQEWIKDYAKAANIKGFIIGISGGIDSAVTSGLCVNAVGKENVMGLALPCESISQDLEDAKLVVQNIGINFHVIDLTETYRELIKVMPSGIESYPMARANIKPRLRMTTLYYIGQSLGYLVGGTGNRAEMAIGYFTKYGDGGVDIEPIGALYKYEVREVARVLKIPEKIIKRAPSAGLWEGQTDEGEIGMSYDVIDEILYRLDYDLDLDGLNKEDVEKVKKMMKSTEHKNKIPPMYEIPKD